MPESGGLAGPGPWDRSGPWDGFRGNEVLLFDERTPRHAPPDALAGITRSVTEPAAQREVPGAVSVFQPNATTSLDALGKSFDPSVFDGTMRSEVLASAIPAFEPNASSDLDRGDPLGDPTRPSVFDTTMRSEVLADLENIAHGSSFRLGASGSPDLFTYSPSPDLLSYSPDLENLEEVPARAPRDARRSSWSDVATSWHEAATQRASLAEPVGPLARRSDESGLALTSLHEVPAERSSRAGPVLDHAPAERSSRTGPVLDNLPGAPLSPMRSPSSPPSLMSRRSAELPERSLGAPTGESGPVGFGGAAPMDLRDSLDAGAVRPQPNVFDSLDLQMVAPAPRSRPETGSSFRESSPLNDTLTDGLGTADAVRFAKFRAALTSSTTAHLPSSVRQDLLRKIEPRRETSPSLQAGAYAQLGMSPPLGHPSTPPSDSGLPPRVSSSAESRRRQNLADLRAQR